MAKKGGAQTRRRAGTKFVAPDTKEPRELKRGDRVLVSERGEGRVTGFSRDGSVYVRFTERGKGSAGRFPREDVVQA